MTAALFVAALVIALVDEFRAHGESLTGWAVVLLCLGLLVGRI